MPKEINEKKKTLSSSVVDFRSLRNASLREALSAGETYDDALVVAWLRQALSYSEQIDRLQMCLRDSELRSRLEV